MTARLPCFLCMAFSLMMVQNLSADDNLPTEPIAKDYSAEKAITFLEDAARTWHKKHDGCFSCHTNYAYLYAKPVVSKATEPDEVRQALEDLVTKRWPVQGPRWDAEVVASAAALAYHDASTTRKLHPVTKTALDRMWQVQRADGGWSWLKCGWPPMESDDHYGATLAAIAVGIAPEQYAQTELAQKGLEKLRGYLQKQEPKHLHHRAMILWANTYVNDLMPEKAKSDTIRELLAKQLPDGGWSAASLGDWKRADKKEQSPDVSDGYGTGFVIYVLRQAKVPAEDPALQRGITWLKSNQRESGRWFARSLNKDTKHYLTHIGSAFAVMALVSCDELQTKK